MTTLGVNSSSSYYQTYTWPFGNPQQNASQPQPGASQVNQVPPASADLQNIGTSPNVANLTSSEQATIDLQQQLQSLGGHHPHHHSGKPGGAHGSSEMGSSNALGGRITSSSTTSTDPDQQTSTLLNVQV